MGYLNGICWRFVGQLPKLLGFRVQGESFVQQAGELASGIAGSRINAVALALGVSSLS